MAYSYDLRIRVVAKLSDGYSVEQVAGLFNLSVRTVYGWMKLQRETGDVKPREGASGPKLKLETQKAEIVKLIETKPELTLEDIKAQFKLDCCLKTLWNALTRWGHTHKKSHQGSRATAT